jgi:tRNA 2-thiouridine synthesizing protein E
MNSVIKINCVVTADGRLKDLSEWSKSVAEWLATNDGITLTGAHWEIIDVMREYYQMYNTSPTLKLLKREIQEKLNLKKAEDTHLNALFPKGFLLQATKIAGLPVTLLDVEIENKPARPNQSSDMSKTLASGHKHFRGSFEYLGKQIPVHEKGNLVNLEDWDEAMAEFIASHENIVLTNEHWEIIKFMRKFYFTYGITPMVRLLIKKLNDQSGARKYSDEYLYKLFPGGPSRQGSRFAGLPEPQGCIDD